MKYQIYLSGAVQKHFGLAAKNVQPDSDVDPEPGWFARWRIEYVLASSDESQHLFLATNEASLYSFVIPLLDDEGFETLVSQFYRHCVDALFGRGLDLRGKLLHESQFLRGRPNRLIGAMNQLVYAVTHCAYERDDVKTMHREVRHMLISEKEGNGYIRPDEEFERLLASAPPYPPLDPETEANIVQFSSPN